MSRTVAVLGAGIMGSSIALHLARKGIRSTLIDSANAPMRGASRWNEGNIHLGFLYAADPSLATARAILPGGLRFGREVAELTGSPLGPECWTDHDDTFLIHTKSVAPFEETLSVARRVASLVRSHPHMMHHPGPAPGREPEPLSRSELEEFCDTTSIVGGFRVPERSVNTNIVADRFADAVGNSAHIEMVMGQTVLSVRRRTSNKGLWEVELVEGPGSLPAWLGPFDAVVNATWQGRAAIDVTAGLMPPPIWTHRFRVSLFARTSVPCPLRSAVIAVGPFGDVKNYDGHNLYLSWYPVGLLVESNDLAAPATPVVDEVQRARIAAGIAESLISIFPGLAEFRTDLAKAKVEGGWVYAQGRGTLSDPKSDLHRRDAIGMRSLGTYFSVDTGKYSIAPFVARHVAAAVDDASRS